jgi:hypothetical protein
MRNGTFARLPNQIRDQINSRLQDGQKPDLILDWLNAIPEVRTASAGSSRPRPSSCISRGR